MRVNRRQLMKSVAGVAGAAAVRHLWAADQPPSPADLARDPNRPQFHLLPLANWMNDPNGPVFWKGKYHMFYQYNPDGAYWGDMHWGHAVSPDMVHWKHLPVALSPTPGSADSAGCFTGSAVIDGHRVSLLYTGISPAPASEATIHSDNLTARESQCLATALDDELTEWSKNPSPVIAGPPQGLNVAGFRDPCPWREGDRWYTGIGSGIRGGHGMVLLYQSKDLRLWNYLQPLTSNPDFSTPETGGGMWECPDFFPLGDRHVLIHSARGKSWWQCGVFDPGKLSFHAETGGPLDYGSYYAAKSQLDRSGNRILWGWIQETRPEAEYRKAGWAGVMSLPRILTLSEDHRLQFDLPPAVYSLRRDLQKPNLADDATPRRAQIAKLQIQDACGELTFAFRTEDSPMRLLLMSDKTVGAPLLAFSCDAGNPAEIRLDGTAIPVHPAKDGLVHVRYVIDASVIEVFINKQVACTRRIYYAEPEAPVLRVQLDAGLMSLTEISIAQLAPISRNRMTI